MYRLPLGRNHPDALTPPEGSEHAFRGEKPTPTRFSGNALLVSVTLADAAGAAGAVSQWPDGDESTALAEDDEDDEDEATPNTADRGQPIDLSETTQL